MAKFRILRSDDTQAIDGVVNSYAYAGQGFQMDPSDPTELIPADTTRGFQLVRNVVTADDIDSLEQHHFPNRTLDRPEVIGNVCSAHRALEIECEGAEYLVLSSTGDLSGAAAGQELGYKDGKFRAQQAGDELVGYIRASVPPEHGEAVRFRIELV